MRPITQSTVAPITRSLPSDITGAISTIWGTWSSTERRCTVRRGGNIGRALAPDRDKSGCKRSPLNVTVVLPTKAAKSFGSNVPRPGIQVAGDDEAPNDPYGNSQEGEGWVHLMPGTALQRHAKRVG